MSKNKQKTRYFHFGIYIDRNWKKKKKKVKLRMRNLFGFHKFKRSHLLSNTFFVKLCCYSRRGKQFNSKRKFRILKCHILRACACMVCCKSFQILLWNYRSALKPSFVALREWSKNTNLRLINQWLLTWVFIKLINFGKLVVY